MSSSELSDWHPWRAKSPLGGARPSRADTGTAISSGLGRQDVLPFLRDRDNTGLVRILIVGINPSPWTAAVNAPFARPGNRFWVSLAEAGITEYVVDASRGLSRRDEHMLAARGIGITNIVSRPTARADELTKEELVAGGTELVKRVERLRPKTVAILGISAFRVSFDVPKASLGRQGSGVVRGWPDGVHLWALPNPSGLNAHETIASLAEKWAPVWASAQ